MSGCEGLDIPGRTVECGAGEVHLDRPASVQVTVGIGDVRVPPGLADEIDRRITDVSGEQVAVDVVFGLTQRNRA